ncbi:MAG: acetyl-CoA carboxylase biotin carboxyl carrier protein [Candidatus Neomarinimicrobiota bacterium]
MLKQRLKELIAIVEESGINELEVSTWWGRKIRITKHSPVPGGANQPSPAPAALPGPPEVMPPVITPAAPLVAATDSSNHHTINSPIVGTFYTASSPDTPPYIKPGDRITKGQTICIIEAMKIMNEIESDLDGTVVEILVENGTPVEFNHPLVVVDPA